MGTIIYRHGVAEVVRMRAIMRPMAPLVRVIVLVRWDVPFKVDLACSHLSLEGTLLLELMLEAGRGGLGIQLLEGCA